MLRVEAQTRLGGLALDVALGVRPGECLALAGPSGAGKTSVLRVAAGLLRPERGLVEAGGRPGSTRPAGETCRRSGAAVATCSRSTRSFLT